MFGEDAKRRLEARAFDARVRVPGLSAAAPEVACDARGLCLMTTSMGYANAASSTAAVALSDRFDLSQTYVLIDGIAGVDPNDGHRSAAPSGRAGWSTAG